MYKSLLTNDHSPTNWAIYTWINFFLAPATWRVSESLPNLPTSRKPWSLVGDFHRFRDTSKEFAMLKSLNSQLTVDIASPYIIFLRLELKGGCQKIPIFMIFPKGCLKMGYTVYHHGIGHCNCLPPEQSILDLGILSKQIHMMFMRTTIVFNGL